MNALHGFIKSALLILACASNILAATPNYQSVLIADVPHVKQEPDFCGEACIEMYLGKLGYEIDQKQVFNVSGTDPALGRGCHTKEMLKALEALGFEPGATWYKVKARDDAQLLSQWAALHADLLKQIPSIVCMRTSDDSSASEHFRLMLGYDADKAEVIYHEPAETNAGYSRMKLSEFLQCWPLKYKQDEWTTIRMRLKIKKISSPAKTDGFTNADFALHIMQLRKMMPKSGFTMVIAPPFVVIGDETPEMVAARAEQTVRWAALRLKKQYFKKDPADIIDIWLFKDNASYMKHAKLLFNDTPDTPFGYSSPSDKALVMNIATGGGTLVHEMVHPFMDANFPQCPAWFNEGMGSLYEQSRGKGESIMGLTNWRLRGLQDAIGNKSLPSFKELTGTTTYEFYKKDKGSNYAQARYLCYYLQQKDLLQKFYREFTAKQESDPTGYKSLQKILNEKDMDAFQRKWETFVMGLTFP